MQMNAEEDKGVIFFESCINLKWQKHTSIEAIPVPFELFDELPGYFRVSDGTRGLCMRLPLRRDLTGLPICAPRFTGSDRHVRARVVSAQEAYRVHSGSTVPTGTGAQLAVLYGSL